MNVYNTGVAGRKWCERFRRELDGEDGSRVPGAAGARVLHHGRSAAAAAARARRRARRLVRRRRHRLHCRR